MQMKLTCVATGFSSSTPKVYDQSEGGSERDRGIHSFELFNRFIIGTECGHGGYPFAIQRGVDENQASEDSSWAVIGRMVSYCFRSLGRILRRIFEGKDARCGCVPIRNEARCREMGAMCQGERVPGHGSIREKTSRRQREK